jgi:hypothetical protein
MTIASLMPTIGGKSVAPVALAAALCSPTWVAAQELNATGAALDVHTHIASQLLVDMLTGGGVPAAGADDLVKKLDEANVKRAIVLSAAYSAGKSASTTTPTSSPRTTMLRTEWQNTPTDCSAFAGSIRSSRAPSTRSTAASRCRA